MINFLKGVLVQKTPTRVVIEVNSIGFEVNITLPCYENLGNIGDEVEIITYLHVREDILQLYGFGSENERQLFLHLISTPGIGPKKAQVILSSVNAELFQQYILEENLAGLTSLSGVGKKTAQRLILDLKDKVKTATQERELIPITNEEFPGIERLIKEAEAALISLGFAKNSAHLAVLKVLNITGEKTSLEELIKQALRHL